jgi:hypothetical protein
MRLSEPAAAAPGRDGKTRSTLDGRQEVLDGGDAEPQLRVSVVGDFLVEQQPERVLVGSGI